MEIKLVDLLLPEYICLDLAADEKLEAIKEMADLLEGKGKILDKRAFLRCLIEREELETTGIGEGVALPHGRTDAVKEMVMVFARSIKGIDFEALDEKPVHLFFLIAAPRSESTKVLKLLAKVSRLLHNVNFRQALLKAETKEQIIELIKQREQ
jgi:fructose-specific phosphotransferase system IIA component